MSQQKTSGVECAGAASAGPTGATSLEKNGLSKLFDEDEKESDGDKGADADDRNNGADDKDTHAASAAGRRLTVEAAASAMANAMAKRSSSTVLKRPAAKQAEKPAKQSRLASEPRSHGTWFVSLEATRSQYMCRRQGGGPLSTHAIKYRPSGLMSRQEALLEAERYCKSQNSRK